MSPVHAPNLYWVPAVPACGLVAVIVAVSPALYQPPPDTPPRTEFKVSRYCVIQFAVAVFGASIVTVVVKEVDVIAPLQLVNAYWVPVAPGCGLVAVIVAVPPRQDQPPPRPPPPDAVMASTDSGR